MRSIRLVNSSLSLSHMVDYLRDWKRKVPAIVVTQSMVKREAVVPPKRVQDHFGDRAQVFYLQPFVHDRFNAIMKSSSLSIVPSGVRIFAPNFKLSDRPSRHHMWNESAIDMLGEKFYDEIVEKALSANYFGNREPLESCPVPTYQPPERTKKTILSLRKPNDEPESVVSLLREE